MTDASYPTFSHMTKETLRSRLRGERKEYATAEAALSAQRHILNDPVWMAARIVALYVPLAGEMDTTLLQHMARLMGKQLWLPRCIPEAGQGVMEFAQCQTLSLRPGPFSLMEPDPKLCPSVPESLGPDVLVVPAIAYDAFGYRLGYGGGYYDRFLGCAGSVEGWKRTRLLGLVPRKLVIDQLPHDPWDIPVHGIATEEGVTWL